jgi:hypothetical protein
VTYNGQTREVFAKVCRVVQAGRTCEQTAYPSAALTLADGDVFAARADAAGTVTAYRNGTQVYSVQLNAADAAYFNNRGGRTGIWTGKGGQPIDAWLDDFGGGQITPLASAQAQSADDAGDPEAPAQEERDWWLEGPVWDTFLPAVRAR